MSEPLEAVADPAPPLAPPTAGRDLLFGVAMIWGLDLALGIAIVLASGLKAEAHPPGQILWTSLLSGAWTVAVSAYFVCRRRGLSFREGFALKDVGRRTALGSALLGGALGIGAWLVMDAFSTGASAMAELASTPGGLAVLSVLAFAMVPVEELYYRGFIFPALRDRWGATTAVVLTTLWFWAAHVFQLFGDPAGIAVILVVATTFTLQRHRSGSLVPPLLTHAAYNGVLVTLSFA